MTLQDPDMLPSDLYPPKYQEVGALLFIYPVKWPEKLSLFAFKFWTIVILVGNNDMLKKDECLLLHTASQMLPVLYTV